LHTIVRPVFWIESRTQVPITTGFNHVATVTSSIDTIVKFYADAFGAAVTFEMAAQEGHPRMVILDLGGGAALNVVEVQDADIVGDRRRQGGRGPIDHFGLAVDSLETLEATRDRLRELGADTGEIHQLGSEWSLFFRDPDGMELEVCCHVSR
jgi:catechol 2,3-dioxygenase-like lactoylglutathione lyase family enzyme